jgi:hypothetical protein
MVTVHTLSAGDTVVCNSVCTSEMQQTAPENVNKALPN